MEAIQAVSNGGNISLSEICSLINEGPRQVQTLALREEHQTKQMKANDQNCAKKNKRWKASSC